MKLSRRQKLTQTAFLTVSRFTRGMTMGVRALVVDDRERVLLLRHTYVNGWYFPGGAIDPGENAFDAVGRELTEEAGIELSGPPRLISVFQNVHASARDHVVLFHCPDWIQKHTPTVPNREIAELGFLTLMICQKTSRPERRGAYGNGREMRLPPRYGRTFLFSGGWRDLVAH